MTKSDLKNRMVVEVRDGKRYLVVDELLMRDSGWLVLSDYDEDLMHKYNKNYDIVKVFDCVKRFDNVEKCNDVIWERQEPKKITLKELEDILGYPVEIVEEMTVEEEREKIADYCRSRACENDKKTECPLYRKTVDCSASFKNVDDKGIEECYKIVFGAESEE